MALKDLKSDLSKFRKPVEKPLTEQKRVEVPKSSNQTPLSQFVDSAPDAPKSQTTTPKQGVTPNKFDNSPKFMGETTPSQFDNSSNYLGETTPSQMSLKERFLGQTEPNTVQQGDKFKGETETANITQGDRFKGQTTPQDYSNAEKFKGETSPSEFKFVKQFLGETTPTDTSLTARFLGETTPSSVEQGDKFKGETTPTLITSDPNLEKQAKDPSYVDFFTNDDGRGFLPFLQPMSKSKFVGVDPSQTKFDETTSLYALAEPKSYDDKVISLDLFTGFAKLDSRYDFTNPNQYGVSVELDNGLGKTYTSKVLKDVYNKYNLKEDSYNTSVFKQPFILSGIQRKKGEPETIGVGSFSFIRGGAVTAAAKAVIDVARMSEFLLTPRGVTWILKQEGMQRSQRWGKTFSPVNLLASLAGQHLGLRFDRPGKTPIGDETWKYQAGKPRATLTLQEGVTSPGKIRILYDQLDGTTEGLPYLASTDARGGFGSFYGIGITTTTRGVNTFGNSSTLEIGFSKYSESQPDQSPLIDRITSTYREIPPTSVFPFGITLPEKSTLDKTFEKRGLYKSEGLLPGQPDIADYEAISYGTISKLANGDTPSNYKGDFRNLKGTSIESSDYSENNLSKKYKLPQTFKTNAERLNEVNKSLKSDSVYDNVFSGGELTPDFVHLFFAFDTTTGAQDSSKIIQFRATINGVTETFSPSWNGIKYPGRADKAYMYSEFERTLSFNFKAYATSRSEMRNMWNKLDRLSRLTMPTYGSAYSGHICYFRMGDLWGTGKEGVPTLITSLTYTIPDDLSWDVNQDNGLAELPMGVDVSVGLTILPDTIYDSEKSHYSTSIITS